LLLIILLFHKHLQQPQPSMDDLANRFSILQCRFVQFSQRVPVLLRTWLSQRGVPQLEISFEILAIQLFQLEGFSGVLPGVPPEWVVTIARCALVDQLQVVPFTQYGAKRSSVIFMDIAATLQVEWQLYSRTCVVLCPPDDDAAALRRRNSLLEIRVLELEATIAGRVSTTSSSVQRPVTVVPFPLSQCAADRTHAFLLEKRFEAEDSIRTLQRLREEFILRERTLESQTTRRIHGLMGRHRIENMHMRQDLRMATDENASLRAELGRFYALIPPEAPLPEKVDSLGSIITARRALRFAGFWGVPPNDVTNIIPLLSARYTSLTGKAGKRRGNQLCFSSHEMEIVIRAVVDVMRDFFPAYTRVAGRAV
jgi:hypothetical protein